ncbi:zinc-binding alcohol dehydrogenase, partial [Opitutales bacterium]|nr:zinc-binding alcohol dehydrogenase [Opitutales bacterium]
MKQILQNLSSGETLLANVPAPKARAGHLLIETEASLVSLGTEKMLINFGKANLLDKARQQPEKVMQVLQKIKTDGLMPTLEVVRSKLDTPLPLGYCNVGRVIEVGAGVDGFQVGDRVLSNSNHAEIVCAPKNLCAKVPEGVSAESAAFGVVGAIGLQGIRLLEPTLGETFVVTGLGLIGQLAVQTLIASGCKVIGIDFDSSKCALAKSLGAEV